MPARGEPVEIGRIQVSLPASSSPFPDETFSITVGVAGVPGSSHIFVAFIEWWSDALTVSDDAGNVYSNVSGPGPYLSPGMVYAADVEGLNSGEKIYVTIGRNNSPTTLTAIAYYAEHLRGAALAQAADAESIDGGNVKFGQNLKVSPNNGGGEIMVIASMAWSRHAFADVEPFDPMTFAGGFTELVNSLSTEGDPVVPWISSSTTRVAVLYEFGVADGSEHWPEPTTSVTWPVPGQDYTGSSVGGAIYAFEIIPAGDGVDLAETANGWKFRTYHEGGSVYAQRSMTEGETWETAVLVDNVDVDPEAAPSLAVDPASDNLHLWYHTTTAQAKGFVSEDFGATWTLYATETGLRFPRPCFLPDRFLLAAMNGSNLVVYQSQDFGDTREVAVTFAQQPEQRAVLFADRHGTAHIIYQDNAGALLHRASDAPDRLNSWADVTTLVAAGDFPAAAPGLTNGLLMWFEGAALMVGILTSDYSALDFETVAPSGSFKPLWSGVVYEQYDGVLWVGKDTGEVRRTRHLEHPGFAWSILE